jgi:cytoskeletal protein RodZ
MPTVAEQLRQAREARGLSLHQVGDILKIRTDHLQALEAGDYKPFSAPVYVKGFVRAYSRLLKLDERQVMAALDGEMGQIKKLSEPPPLTDEPRTILDYIMLQLSKLKLRNVVIGLSAIVTVLIIWLGVSIWRSHHASDPLKNLPPAVYRGKSGSGDTLPVPKR